MIKLAALIAAGAALLNAQHPMDAYNVVWNSVGKGSSDSMPLGNGDLGLNVWTEENGDIVLYVAKSDAWSENGQLLKLGRVRLRFSQSPFAGATQFRQTLSLHTGEVVLQAGDSKVSIWVDANHPAIRVDADLSKAADLQVSYERWRDQTRVMEGAETDSVYGMAGGPETLRVSGDAIAQDVEDALVWYHRNLKSPIAGIMKHQSVGEALVSVGDSLADRIFGALVRAEGCSRINPTTLRSKTASQKHSVQIFAHSGTAGSTEEWLQALRNSVARVTSAKIEDRRSAHEKIWSDFWDRSYIRITGGPNAAAVSQAYALQRFMNACAGRGLFPIKSNGSLFTVDSKIEDASVDSDYRRRGGAYWFQQTAPVYWQMLASGDSEMMLPLFNMYVDALPVAMRRTKAYFNHDGAYFPEIMYAWGTYTNADYGWSREGKMASFVQNGAIRHHFTNNLELLAMGLDYADYFPQDRTFTKQMLAPLADAILTFFDAHYERDSAGRIRMTPAQALGAYQEAVNPLPDIAGLKYVATRVLAEKVPLTKTGQNAAKRLLQQLPEVPTQDVGGKKALAAAEKVFGEPKSSENAELQAVFPFRLYGLEKPGLDMARATFDGRKNKRTGGVQPDAIQAAYLGLASAARQAVVENFTAKPAMRFPAFWGPNEGWTPDQAHGSVAAMALQSMLLQAEGDRILVSPAWPKDWDVEFKLHAPHGTSVEGVIKAGAIERVKTTPDKRSSDVTRVDPQ